MMQTKLLAMKGHENFQNVDLVFKPLSAQHKGEVTSPVF